MGNLNTDENSKKNKQNKMLGLKTIETEMKNAFDGLNGRLRMTEHTITELEQR